MILFAGPCVIESKEILDEVCRFLKKTISKYDGIEFYFKSSYDKANRSSIDAFRGPGLDEGLEILAKIKDEQKVGLITDVHQVSEVEKVKEVVDVLQVPAFLSRQTDLLEAVAKSGRIVNVKKGQFLAPWDMGNVREKLKRSGAKRIIFTERGASFGYNNLVVDYRSFPIMRSLGVEVVFDATHSLQLPGGKGSSSDGQRGFIPYLARAAAACGVDGFFFEVHPEPDKALCDGPNMVDFKMFEDILDSIMRIRAVL
ncbi:3-deoxy-8-phosphooctulonate synthase [Calditerrivibrio nitroreducens]|uniref:3-deoxy-8-phosphooctulonate synthase n=1 Tax=Calditerrivibrio nitroreducens (strain DSM 19672 / NBRC 101217 / Yu37-1) TaxID=768670 RepID=E4TK68_CALNY|nr:3-deoxy-8-phosphooctulonate synthase [Calditerrivibrio nitroreducens]ADR19344.1 2-dehydro-3-deoxyphosphooctonate aldolase [Calditerrivibrio nitroreducens DSM 19672]